MPVYFIRSGDTGPVKIGWADDVEKRRKQLQVSHPYPLQVVRVIECSRGTERWLQRHYEAAQLLGEWFVFDAEMLAIAPPDLPPLSNWRQRAKAKKERPSRVSWAADRCSRERPCTQCLGLLPGIPQWRLR